MINIKQFAEVELKVGEIKEASTMENADKLLKLLIDIGEERTILSGIAEHYTPEDLIGKRCIVVSNLEPKEMRGVESNGMILCASFDNKVKLIEPDKDIPVGSEIK